MARLCWTLVCYLTLLSVTILALHVTADEGDSGCKNSPSMSDPTKIRNYVNNCLKARDRIRFRKREMEPVLHGNRLTNSDNSDENLVLKQNILLQILKQRFLDQLNNQQMWDQQMLPVGDNNEHSSIRNRDYYSGP